MLLITQLLLDPCTNFLNIKLRNEIWILVSLVLGQTSCLWLLSILTLGLTLTDIIRLYIFPQKPSSFINTSSCCHRLLSYVTSKFHAGHQGQHCLYMLCYADCLMAHNQDQFHMKLKTCLANSWWVDVNLSLLHNMLPLVLVLHNAIGIRISVIWWQQYHNGITVFLR